MVSATAKSSLYHGTINKAELDAGYGMGMAITRNRKEAVLLIVFLLFNHIL
jgi:hypothetical protein